MSLEVPLSQQGRCAVHPDLPAGGTCSRCGSFFCADCATSVSGLGARLYCQACAARPDVNYLETLRQRYWGRRDGWAWMVGGVTLLLCVTTAAALAQWGLRATKESLFTLLLLVPVPVGVAFFLGRRWARHALIVTPLVMAVAADFLHRDGRFLYALCVSLGLIFALRIHRDVRNQLFFRLPVPPGTLQALWNERFNNPMARQASRFGFSALFMPMIAPVAVICGVVALRRVDPKATPPIGRRNQALMGLVLGLVSPLLWGFVLLLLLTDRIHF
ncbi:hypothetical protein COCOR_00005 [Corallococcus coralloides DSM 2259]|uniref:Uncharacterized protein n=1 Tax=Corallococcus coralloides (strain ATCC 25202 / DSM 2259 / NBRC 100086 / M2) TaxID=1144275 RepID=H8MRW9_CORCM|nr:hypothetical protein [Corallococcus coralloides]AFE03206.1 hypothetical protein COCOR_00005 [Corallococcus coralloides DSM 2259]